MWGSEPVGTITVTFTRSPAIRSAKYCCGAMLTVTLIVSLCRSPWPVAAGAGALQAASKSTIKISVIGRNVRPRIMDYLLLNWA